MGLLEKAATRSGERLAERDGLLAISQKKKSPAVPSMK